MENEVDYEQVKDWANTHTPFMEHSGFYITKITKDSAEVECHVKDYHLNPYNITHGGLLFSMADVATGSCARADGRRYVTQQASVSFIRAGHEGETITAKSTVIHRGRSSCILDATIVNEEGKLLFKGQFTYFCINQEAGSENKMMNSGK